MIDFSSLVEPGHVRVECDLECERILASMRAGELTNAEAWDLVQATTAAADARIAQLAQGATWADAAGWAPAPRWLASRLNDHQLASAVLRADGHYRDKVACPLVARLAAAPLASLEPIQLIRAYLVR